MEKEKQQEMNYETLELSSEIVSAYCSKNYLSTSELVSLIKEVASVLAELKNGSPYESSTGVRGDFPDI